MRHLLLFCLFAFSCVSHGQREEQEPEYFSEEQEPEYFSPINYVDKIWKDKALKVKAQNPGLDDLFLAFCEEYSSMNANNEDEEYLTTWMYEILKDGIQKKAAGQLRSKNDLLICEEINQWEVAKRKSNNDYGLDEGGVVYDVFANILSYNTGLNDGDWIDAFMLNRGNGHKLMIIIWSRIPDPALAVLPYDYSPATMMLRPDLEIYNQFQRIINETGAGTMWLDYFENNRVRFGMDCWNDQELNSKECCFRWDGTNLVDLTVKN